MANAIEFELPMTFWMICKGRSLNDCYWVVHEDDTATFAEVNLYENPFSNVLASLAFTGYGSSPRSSLRSSPEFTTNGMLPKCWRRIGGKVYLYKGGTVGASNAGFEPYSEYYAAQVAQTMGSAAFPMAFPAGREPSVPHVSCLPVQKSLFFQLDGW